ncbi:MAG: amidophosphoribosyltransferase [Alistipes sp.]|nr:amidophosphoribosyltransferase [Alistipes sp.]
MSVLGVYGIEHVSSILYYGLHTMQHRGQEGCGMVCVDADGNMKRHRGIGLVSEVFKEQHISAMDGKIGIGHVLYTGADARGVDNLQPLYFHHGSGDFALAHNGNVVNSKVLTDILERKGSLFHSHSDAELLAHLIKKDDPDEPRIFSIIEALKQMEGAFAFLIMTKNRLYACRDKYGFHPLSIGKIDDGYVVSSETCAFDTIGAEFVRDIAPGEIVTIDKKGIRSSFYSDDCRCKMCAMEYIYFARPDSDIEGCNVHAYRKESGRRLFHEAPADADIVVGVPDSSLSAAQGYSEASGMPYEMGLIKNKYVGRTFIQPSQSLREKGVRMKLSPVRSIVNGKRVVLVDDSIVRGTTSRRIVGMLREAGATEVHVRIASPTMTHPCFYGVDTSTLEELMLARMNIEDACKAIGADSLAFLSYEATLKSASGRSDMCLACFDGKYPTPLYEHIEDVNK